MSQQDKKNELDYVIKNGKEGIYPVVGRHPDTDFVTLVDAIDVQLLIHSHKASAFLPREETKTPRLTWKMVCAKALVASAAKVRREAKDRMVVQVFLSYSPEVCRSEAIVE